MFTKQKDKLQSDPNFRMLLNVLVTAETDPESMGVPVVLDNRTGLFKDVLDLFSDAFVQGNIMGELPIHVVNTDAEMKRVLSEIKDVRQRTPIIKKHHDKVNQHTYKPDIENVPNDGVYTVFIGGGHATNSKRDMSDAEALGYMCAERGWRIVTGAGSVEGVMGAAHTGFIQYHLDKFAETPGHETLKVQLSKYQHGPGHYDAEELIKKNPRLVEEMANEGIIPRKMFYGYSMDALLEMESPSGKAPPGITYYDAGNRFRRLQGLLDAGTKIFMPGGIGTYEELEETLVQHLKMRSNPDASFKEGTPSDMSKIIIYNRNGNLDKLLAHYGLLGDGDEAQKLRKDNGIVVIDQVEALKGSALEAASSWQARIAEQRKSGREDGMYKLAP
jgi:hypothetical protein